VAVLLALVAVVAVPRRSLLPALFLLASFAFAQAWPLARWSYALPGLALGGAGRILCLSWALWPWLAALGLDALLARAPRALPTLLAGSFACALLLFVSWRGLEPGAWAEGLRAHDRRALPPDLEGGARAGPHENAIAAAEHLREAWRAPSRRRSPCSPLGSRR
jgi:hypothetical protein